MEVTNSGIFLELLVAYRDLIVVYTIPLGFANRYSVIPKAFKPIIPLSENSPILDTLVT